jgi:hypothetical protein
VPQRQRTVATATQPGHRERTAAGQAPLRGKQQEGDGNERQGECQRFPGRVIDTAQTGEHCRRVHIHPQKHGYPKFGKSKREDHNGAERDVGPHRRYQDTGGDPPWARHRSGRLLHTAVDTPQSQCHQGGYDRRESQRKHGNQAELAEQQPGAHLATQKPLPPEQVEPAERQQKGRQKHGKSVQQQDHAAPGDIGSRQQQSQCCTQQGCYQGDYGGQRNRVAKQHPLAARPRCFQDLVRATRLDQEFRRRPKQRQE